MSRRIVVALVLFGLVLSFVACSAPMSATRSDGGAPMEAPAPASMPALSAESRNYGVADQADTDRMIIRTADLSLIVTDAAAAQANIAQAVEAMGGYIADSSTWREGEQLRARMTVRVPAEQLDALRDAAKALAVRVLTDNVKGQDVTEEYSDLSAQLVNLEATETELRELLSEVRQRTQKAEDILQVYRELTTIRGQIEQVKGRIQYLSTLTSLATVNVELIPDVLAKPVVEPGWRPLETIRSAGRDLVNALQVVADGLIRLVLFVVPVLIIVAIPFAAIGFAIRWLVRRMKRNRVK